MFLRQAQLYIEMFWSNVKYEFIFLNEYSRLPELQHLFMTQKNLDKKFFENVSIRVTPSDLKLIEDLIKRVTDTHSSLLGDKRTTKRISIGAAFRLSLRMTKKMIPKAEDIEDILLDDGRRKKLKFSLNKIENC